MGLIRILDGNRRLGAAAVLILIGAANLGGNALWLLTGDIHHPQLHVTMRGGWWGFWLTTGLAAAGLLIGLVLVRLERRAGRSA